MADNPIENLNQITTIADTDVIAIVDDPAGTPETKKSPWSLIKSTLKTYFDSLYAAIGHNHSGTYEPANSNIQSHIGSSSNPHSVTKAQVGLGNVDNIANASQTVVGTLVTGNADAIVSSATTTTPGKTELATTTEVNTGSDAGRVVTPDALAGSNLGERIVSVLLVEPGTDVAAATDVAMYSIPSSYDGMNLVEVHAEVKTAGTTGVTTIDINKNGTSMLSTKLTIDSGETGSDTAATAAVIDTAQDDVTSFDLITIDVDGISTTAPKGLVVTSIYRLP